MCQTTKVMWHYGKVGRGEEREKLKGSELSSEIRSGVER